MKIIKDEQGRWLQFKVTYVKNCDCDVFDRCNCPGDYVTDYTILKTDEVAKMLNAEVIKEQGFICDLEKRLKTKKDKLKRLMDIVEEVY